MGQMVRKILVTHLRKEGYLTTNKRKMGQEQENGEKSLFDGEGDRSPNNGEGERKE
jgi:hypothetical protein